MILQDGCQSSSLAVIHRNGETRSRLHSATVFSVAPRWAPLITNAGDQGIRDWEISPRPGEFPPSDKSLTYKNTPNSPHTLPHAIKVYSEEFGLRITNESLFKEFQHIQFSKINIQ